MFYAQALHEPEAREERVEVLFVGKFRVVFYRGVDYGD